MTAHRCHMNGTEPVVYWNRLLVSHTEPLPQLFDINLPKITSQCLCPFPRCMGSSRTLNGLQNHLTNIIGGTVSVSWRSNPSHFTNTRRYESQVPPWHLRNQNYESKKFRIREEHRIRRATLQHCFEAIQVENIVNAKLLEPVVAFPYLGCTVTYNNSVWSALYH